QPEDAVRLHEEAVSIARTLADQRGLAVRLGNLGNSNVALHQFQAAIPLFEESALLYRDLGEKGMQAQRLGVIGNLYAALGRSGGSRRNQIEYQQNGLKYYVRTLEIVRELGDQRSEADLLRSLGALNLELRSTDEAIVALDEAVRLYTALNLPELADSTRALYPEAG
ncbi:MAG: hypothetical protein J0M07_29000, partial [Anaerolineae bacterium]|nr:hypothetical protein [Anaerolineae bacterium]